MTLTAESSQSRDIQGVFSTRPHSEGQQSLPEPTHRFCEVVFTFKHHRHTPAAFVIASEQSIDGDRVFCLNRVVSLPCQHLVFHSKLKISGNQRKYLTQNAEDKAVGGNPRCKASSETSTSSPDSTASSRVSCWKSITPCEETDFRDRIPVRRRSGLLPPRWLMMDHRASIA